MSLYRYVHLSGVFQNTDIEEKVNYHLRNDKCTDQVQSAMEYLMNLKANYLDIPVNSLESLDIQGHIISKLPNSHHHESAHVSIEVRFCVSNSKSCCNRLLKTVLEPIPSGMRIFQQKQVLPNLVNKSYIVERPTKRVKRQLISRVTRGSKRVTTKDLLVLLASMKLL